MEGSVLAANVVMLAVRQRTGRSFDGGGGATARRLPCERSARLGVQGAGRCAGTTLDGAGGGGRKSRAEAAAVGLMDRQTLRDWVVRFNAEGPEGLDRPNVAGPAAEADAGAEAGAATGGRGRTEKARCRSRSRAARRPGGGGQGALRCGLPRDNDWAGLAGARLLSYQPATQASREERAGCGRV